MLSNPDPRQKPPLGSRIDWSHPLARGLEGFFVLNEHGPILVDLAQNAVIHNGAKWREGGLFFDGSSECLAQDINDFNFGLDDFTVILILSFFEQDVLRYFISKYDLADGWAVHQDSSGTGNLTWRIEVENTTTLVGSTPSAPYVGEKIQIAFRCLRNSTACLFIDGKKKTDSEVDITSIAGKSVSTIKKPLVLGSRYGVYYHLGIIDACILYRTGLTDDELMYLAQEPFAAIEWPSMRIFFDLGATVISVADAGVGQEDISLGALLGLLDSGAGAESIENLAVQLALAESGAGDDALPGIESSLSVTDSGSAIDAITITIGDVVISLADVGAAIDAVSAISAHISRDDGGIGADQVGIRASVSLSDEGQGLDVAQVSALIALIEAASGEDTIEGLRAALTVTESGQGQDQVSIDALVSLLEAALGEDAVTVFTDTDVTIVEIRLSAKAPSIRFALRSPKIKFT